MQATAPRPRRRKRLTWFLRLFFLAFPFAILGIAEAVLRSQGFGGYPPAIRYVGSDGKRQWYSTYRPGVDTYFYQQLSLTGGMRTFGFTTPKPANTVRIALLGESAMQGYPQPLPLTNGSFLQTMLRDLWPDRRVEVLNFGATAMASFPSMKFLEELRPHELDLVVIMLGNNEYYGAYGVASLHRAGTSPTGMRFMRWLRSLALKQWLDRKTIHAPTDPEVRRQTLMERVAAVRQVGPDDGLRKAAEITLRTHVTHMVEQCVEQGIPVIVCTMPTNERGMAPIGEDVALPLPEAERCVFEERVAAAERAVADRPAEAVESLKQAIVAYGKHARAHYLLAEALTKLGRHAEALTEYVAARDLDTMPWRSTSAANRANRDAASHGAVLCDLEAAFRRESPGGAIGWELMDDHVHMTLRAQALWAQSVLETMSQLPQKVRVDPAALAALPPWETYAQRLGHTPFDDYTAANRMRVLFDISFMKRSNPAATAAVHRRCDELLAGMTELDRKAVLQWEDPGLHVTDHRPITGVVGYFRMMAGDNAGAAPLFAVARECVANVSLWRLQYTWYLIDCRRHLSPQLSDDDKRLCREAIEVGELLRRFAGFRDPMAPSFLGMAYNAVGEHRAAVAYLDDAVRHAKGRDGLPVVRALANSLVQLGMEDRARLLLNLASRDPEIRPMAQDMLSRLVILPTSAPAGAN